MRLDRQCRWWWAVEVIVTVVCLETTAAPRVLAQGRSTSAAPAVANGRGAGAGRQATGQFVPLRIDPCDSGVGTCERVVRAGQSRPYPTVLARGANLRLFAVEPSKSLVVFVCPCGASCLDRNSYGWEERNLGWAGPSATAGVDVPINFHFAKSLNQLLTTRERLDFRVKWSRAIDGSGDSMLSEAITSYGSGSLPAAGMCRE
jgi:hypothetical protein